MSWIRRLNALFHPEQYHGWGRKKRYFEGWYYKLVDANQSQALAIIPGIAMDEKGNRQAFIQVLDGINQSAEYHKFDANEFQPAHGKFELRIADNYFSENEIRLSLPSLQGTIQLTNKVPWPSSWYSPGIMGPYSFVPLMECYHGILSMDHELAGSAVFNNKTIDFNNGRGYCEKDWGRSFPEGYVWMQTNHFSEPGISLKASVAKIPWLGSSFIGFIAGFLYKGKLYQFTTYNTTKLIQCAIDVDMVQLTMENKDFRLEIRANRSGSTELASPIHGLMDGRIEESMTAEIIVELIDLKQIKSVFKDTGKMAGLEVAGDITQIQV